jgi:hypothetical protein
MYTLFVHGWDIRPTNPSIDYNLHFWDVDLDAGATSLGIDSAPASAVSQTTGEVVVSWTGLEEGRLYFGGVSHSDDTGLLAFTRVEVDTSAP